MIPNVKVKVKPLTELVKIGTDCDNWKNFPDSKGLITMIDNVLYTEEMEELLPEDRCLTVLTECSYFVYQNPVTLDEYKYTKGMFEVIQEHASI